MSTQHKCVNRSSVTMLYSKPSMTRTSVARLPWLIRTRFFEFLRISSDSWGKQIFSEMFLFIMELRRFLWVHVTYRYCIEDQNDFPKLSLLAFRLYAIFNPYRLELPMSRINVHGPKDVRAIVVKWSSARVYARGRKQCCKLHYCLWRV